jgi:polyisoprenoid-binding protein YceI
MIVCTLAENGACHGPPFSRYSRSNHKEREGRMQHRYRKVAAALGAIAVAAAVPLIGSQSDQAVAATSSAPAWTIKPGGALGFAVGNGSDTIGANFAKWGGTINFDPDSPGDAAIHISVDLTSASIGDSFKDQLLQGDEFFNTPATPTATYDSTSVTAQGGGAFLAHGTLNLRGMAMPQDVQFHLTGSGAQRHVEGNASVARIPYGIGTGEHGNGLDSTVKVNFAFDATRQ